MIFQSQKIINLVIRAVDKSHRPDTTVLRDGRCWASARTSGIIRSGPSERRSRDYECQLEYRVWDHLRRFYKSTDSE